MKGRSLGRSDKAGGDSPLPAQPKTHGLRVFRPIQDFLATYFYVRNDPNLHAFS